ncbi:MAG: pitrilysin family protein [Candidatus Omnitrophota bacterium]|nr:pitrilysin family protein [Candidatus Omnitrophota bacterium]
MKRIKFFTLVLPLLILWQGLTFANEAVLRQVLKNGLTVLVKESAPKDLVTIDVAVRAAPKYEQEYLGTGISHLVEHMLFKGTAARKPGDIEKEVRSYGGLIDGAVSSDFTTYQLTVPSKNFAEAVRLLKDMLLNASFDPVEMNRERDVILKEVRMSEDDPEKKAILTLFFNSYIRHPYRYPAIGYEDLLNGLTRNDLVKYYNSRYIPNNIVIAIAGGVDCKDAIALIEKEFKDFRKPDYKASNTGGLEPPQIGKKLIEEEAPSTLSYMAMGFHSTGILSKDLFAMDVLSIILSRGNNSRFNKTLVEDRRVAHSISASNYTPEDPGLFIVSIILDKNNIEESSKLVLSEIDKIKNEGVTDSELETAKKMLLSDYILSKETIEGQARDLCESEIMTGVYDFSDRYIEGINKVTKSDIRRMALLYLNNDNLTEVRLTPKDESVLKDIKVPKSSGEEKIEKKKLPNGLTVLARRSAKVPAVAVTIVFSGGLLIETKENNGISAFVADMMLNGTKSRKEADIKGAIENRGGQIEPFSGFNSFGINIVALKDDLDLALEIAKDVILDSTFPQDEIGKEKVLAIADIRDEDGDIFQYGGLLMKRNLFEGHPYGMRYTGEIETISSFKRDELLNFYHTYCVPNNMVISVSGDIEPEKVFQKVEALFKSAPSRELQKKPLPEMLPGKIKKESFGMDRDQALLVLGFRTVGISNPDRYPLDVLDTLLSGMSGRLFSAIREKSGASYTLGCAQKLGLDTGFFLFYVATTKDKLELSKEKLYGEIKIIKDTAVSEEELNSAKKELVSSYKMLMQTNTSYSFQSALDELYGLGYDNLYKYEDQIKKVTKEDVKRVANKYFTLNAYTEIVIEPE